MALASLGFVVTAVSIVLACIPPDEEPNKMFAVVKVVGCIRRPRRDRRGRVFCGTAAGERSLTVSVERVGHMRPLAFLFIALLSCVRVRRAADDARRLLPHRQREGRALQPRSRRHRAAAVARQSRAADRRRPTAASTSSRSSTRRAGGCSTRAASARSTASGKRPAKPRRSTARSRSRCGFRLPTRRCGSSSRSATRGTCSATSGRVTVDPADKFVAARRRRRLPGALIKLHESGDPGDEAGSADSRRRLHRGASAASSSATRGGWSRRCSRRRRSRSGSSDINIWGLCAGGGAVRHLAAVAAHLPALAGRRDLRRVRLRALRADVREQGVPRHRRERAVRGRRDPVEQRDLRRRRHLRPVQHGRGRQRLGAVHLRPRVRASHRRRSPTSTTPRTWRICRPRIASSRGSRTSTALLDPANAEVEGSRHAGHAAADAVAEGGVRAATRRSIQQRRRADPRREPARSRDGRALPRGADARHGAAQRRPARRHGSARSKARTTRRAATTGRRPTASCSRATTCRSAPSAAAPSKRSSTCIRGIDRPRGEAREPQLASHNQALNRR